MKNINLIDRNIEQNVNSYHLSVQLNQNSISYIIYNIFRNKLILLKHLNFVNKTLDYKESIEELIKNDDFLNKKKYKSVSIILNSINYSLIPDDYYDILTEKKYLEISLGGKIESIANNEIKSIKSKNVFTLSNKIASFLTEQYPNASLFNQMTVFLQRINSLNLDKNKKLFVNDNENSLDIVCMKGESVLFANSFLYKNKEEFVYFILNVARLLNFNLKNTETILSGFISKDQPKYKLLRDYIQEISFIPHNKNFLYSYIFDNFPLHNFSNLFNLIKCE